VKMIVGQSSEQILAYNQRIKTARKSRGLGPR